MLGVPVLTRQAGVNRRAVMKTLAALGMALPAAWLSYRQAGGMADYRTSVGESRKIVLADGSQVDQNGRAQVWTPVTNAHLVCRISSETKTKKNKREYNI